MINLFSLSILLHITRKIFVSLRMHSIHSQTESRFYFVSNNFGHIADFRFFSQAFKTQARLIDLAWVHIITNRSCFYLQESSSFIFVNGLGRLRLLPYETSDKLYYLPTHYASYYFVNYAVNASCISFIISFFLLGNIILMHLT